MTNNYTTVDRKAQDLNRHNRILDPEGEIAKVRRVRRIDHHRCLLETDRGVAQVALDDIFKVIVYGG